MRLESWHSSEDKHRGKIVRTRNYTDVPGDIVSADETTGECSIHVGGETKTLSFGAGRDQDRRGGEDDRRQASLAGFSPEINFGHMLQAAVILVTIGG